MPPLPPPLSKNDFFIDLAPDPRATPLPPVLNAAEGPKRREIPPPLHFWFFEAGGDQERGGSTFFFWRSHTATDPQRRNQDINLYNRSLSSFRAESGERILSCFPFLCEVYWMWGHKPTHQSGALRKEGYDGSCHFGYDGSSTFFCRCVPPKKEPSKTFFV